MRDDKRVQAMSDALASALQLDMTRHWEADLEFWEKAPKSLAITALEAAPALARVTPRKRASMMATYAKMKKSELAKATTKALAGSGWLPDLLVTPSREPRFVATPAGEAALTAANATAA